MLHLLPSHLCSPSPLPVAVEASFLTHASLMTHRPTWTPNHPLLRSQSIMSIMSSEHSLPPAPCSWKFNQGDVGKAPVSLRQKRLWRFCLFHLDAFMQRYTIWESHGVNIMLVCCFLWYMDAGWSFAQQWMSLVINSKAGFLMVLFSLYYLMTKEKQ